MFYKLSTQESFSRLIHTALIYQSLTQANAKHTESQFELEETNAESTELHQKSQHLKMISDK